MLKIKKRTIVAILAITIMLSISVASKPSYALVSQNVKSWYWTSDTNAPSEVTADVNADGIMDIVTAGYYNDGTHWIAQLSVWNGVNMALENTRVWLWGSNTQVSSVAVANITGGSALDIVTGGAYFDGTRWVAQLSVWNGSTLALENIVNWYWTGDTQVSSVAVANITGGSALDIVTGGAYFDGTRWVAQLSVWNGSTLALENIVNWYWNSDTYINSIAISDISKTGVFSIVTGGSYFDGTRNVAQLSIWDGVTLALNNIVNWYWTGDTQVSSVAVANITGGTALDIITGGYYFDNTRNNAQLAVWNGLSLSLQNVVTWYWTSDTKVSSIAVGNLTGGTSLDIITAGTFNDGLKNNAQLIDWNGVNLSVKSVTYWFSTSDTESSSVDIGNFGLGNRVVSSGSFYDGVRSNAQLSIWG